MRSDGKAISWWPVKNVSADAVPAYGLMRLTSVGTDGTANVTKPRGGGAIADLLVNGPTAIPAGGNGQGHRSFPAEIAFDPTGGVGPPAPGEVWGLVSGSFALKPRTAGFMILAEPSGGTVMATPFHGEALIRFRLTDDLGMFGSATAVPRVWSDDDEDISFDGPTITVHDYVGVVPAEGAFTGQCGWATWKTDSAQWEVVAVGDFCSAGTGSAARPANIQLICSNDTIYKISVQGTHVQVLDTAPGCCHSVGTAETGPSAAAAFTIGQEAQSTPAHPSGPCGGTGFFDNGGGGSGGGGGGGGGGAGLCNGTIVCGTPPTVCVDAEPDFDCGGGITGQEWTGATSTGSFTLTKCATIYCMTLLDPDGNLLYQQCLPAETDGGPPQFTGIPTTINIAGLASTITINTTAGGTLTPVSGCTWKCWTDNTTGGRYCSTSDESGTATQYGIDHTTEADCDTGCPQPWTCYQQNVLQAGGVSGFTGCHQDTPPAGPTFYSTSGPYDVEADCTAVCQTQYWCVEYLECSDIDCTADCVVTACGGLGGLGANPGCVSGEIVLDGCFATLSCVDSITPVFAHYEVLGGPFTGPDCDSFCV
jgi:hypothetical protein